MTASEPGKMLKQDLEPTTKDVPEKEIFLIFFAISTGKHLC